MALQGVFPEAGVVFDELSEILKGIKVRLQRLHLVASSVNRFLPFLLTSIQNVRNHLS